MGNTVKELKIFFKINGVISGFVIGFLLGKIVIDILF